MLLPAFGMSSATIPTAPSATTSPSARVTHSISLTATAAAGPTHDVVGLDPFRGRGADTSRTQRAN